MNSRRDIRNLALILIGRLVASAGSGMLGFGLSLYVLDMTGSAGFFSMVLSFSIIPGILVNMFAGGIIDRMDKKKLIVISDVLSALIVCMYIAFFAYSPGNLSAIIVFVILNSFVQSFYALSIVAAIPEMVEEQNVARMNSIMQVITTLLMIVGPVLGALVYKSLGIKLLLYINAFSYLFSAAMAACMRFYSGKKIIATSDYFKDMREALQYLYSNKVLLFLMLICVVINMLYLPMIMLVMPYINYHVIKLSGFQLSLIEAAFGIGGTLGGIYISIRKDSKKMISHLFTFLIVQSILLLLWVFPVLTWSAFMGKESITAVFCLILGTTGLVNMIQNIPLYTHFQLEIPENLRAKVLGFINVSAMIALPLGMWLYGILLEQMSWPILICGTFLLLILICLLFRRNRHFVNFAAGF